MKKGLSLLLALAMLLSLAACSRDKQGPDAPEDGTEPPAAVQPQEPDEPEDSLEPVEPVIPDSQPDEPLPDPEGNDGIADTGENGDEPADEAISASHTDVTLKQKGETFTLSAKGVPGVYASSFTSADPSVASVDETTGLVTAAAPGSTTVTMHIEHEKGQLDFECIVRCRWEEKTENTEEPSQPVSGGAELPSLQDFFTTLQGKYDSLDAMAVIEGDLLENYYPGLSSIAAVEEIYIQETMITMANVAVGLVKLSDSATTEDILAVQAVFQNRIDTQANGGAWYPMSCETWEQAVTTSTSNVVGMFVYPDAAQAMADLFTESFSN